MWLALRTQNSARLRLSFMARKAPKHPHTSCPPPLPTPPLQCHSGLHNNTLWGRENSSFSIFLPEQPKSERLPHHQDALWQNCCHGVFAMQMRGAPATTPRPHPLLRALHGGVPSAACWERLTSARQRFWGEPVNVCAW